MKFGPLKVTDNLKREVILRNVQVSDAEDMIEYLKITAAETPFLLREPDEVTLTIEQEKEFIQSRIDSKRSLMLIATVDGKLAGCSAMSGIGKYRRYSHRCEIAIALYQKYCGRGLGKIMMKTLLDTAKNIGYEQAQLEVIADNTKAIALYEKLGFVKYALFPENMKYSDGTYKDAYLMMKKL